MVDLSSDLRRLAMVGEKDRWLKIGSQEWKYLKWEFGVLRG